MAKYFTESEMVCNCCGQLPPDGIDSRLYDLLDSIRSKLNKPVYVLSGYRCPSHNASVGGVSNSQHLLGKAADITYDDIDVDYLGHLAYMCGARGIGFYFNDGFVHVDVRDNWAEWVG